MKKIISVSLILLFSFSIIAQEIVKDKTYYLDKSKKQKTLGWVFAGVGTSMIVLGTITFSQNFNPVGGGNEGGFLVVLGTPIALSSIPFFISASRNKGRSEATVGFKWQNWDNKLLNKKFPAFALKLSL